MYEAAPPELGDQSSWGAGEPVAAPEGPAGRPKLVLPPSVVGAVAFGIAPSPLIAIYAFVFIAHGTFAPAYPPDITDSTTGEALIGGAVLVFLCVLVLGVFRFLMRRGRWLHLAAQALSLATCVGLVVDPNAGRPVVPILLGVAAAASIILTMVGPSWEWVSLRRDPDVLAAGEQADAAWNQERDYR